MAKNSSEHRTKRSSLNSNLIQVGIVVLIVGGLYLTGYHTAVFGKLQQAVLWTGIFQPDTENSNITPASARGELLLEHKSGKQLKLSELEGKTVFINVWATWCPPCRAEMPGIQKLYKRVDRSKVSFVMLSVDDGWEPVREYVNDEEYDFPVYRPRSPLPKALQSSVVPTTYVLDSDGNIVMKKKGMAKYNTTEFKDYLESQ